MKNLFSLFLLLFSLLGNINAAHYYVSPTGNDNNNGTSPTSPFKTLDKINSISFLPGDIISLKGGVVFFGHLVIDDSGTSTNPITLNAYGGNGRPTIRCQTKTKAVVIRASHFLVKDLKIIGDYVASTDGSRNDVITNAGLVIEANNKNINTITIDNVEVSKFQWFGIKVSASSGSTIDKINILNSVAHNNGYVGIKTTGTNNAGLYNITNVLVDNCLVHHNTGWDDSAAGSGIHLKNVFKGTIQHCEAHHNGGNNGVVGAGGGGGIWASEVNMVFIQFNESHHNETRNADGIGFNFDGGSKLCVMQYNYSHDNDGAGLMTFQYGALKTENITIRYNISENDGLDLKQGAIHAQINLNASNDMRDIYIYNNTVYQDNPNIKLIEIHNVASIDYDIENVHVYNNLFLQPNGGQIFDLVGGGTVTEQNNYRDPIDGNSMLTNPGNGLNGYRLLPNSPLIDAGLLLDALDIPDLTLVDYVGQQDIYGTALPQNGNYDIGADEYNGPFNNPDPSIEVTAPTGGEILAAGDSYNIEWEHNILGSVKIILFKGGQYYQTLVTATENDGLYNWNISNGLSPGSNYQIRIRSNSNPEIDDFTDFFSIVNEGQSSCNLIPNSNFTNGNVSGWNWITEQGALGTFNIAWNKARLSIDHPGTALWQLRLEHESIYLEGGKTYQLRYDAKAWGNRNMSLRIVRKDNYNTLYDEIILLDNAWERSVATFTMPEDGNIGILFRVGANNKTVVLDNITLNEISCPNQNNQAAKMSTDNSQEKMKENIEKELMISIFPNPAAANYPIHLSFLRPVFIADTPVSIKITDLNGRKILERKYDFSTDQITLDYPFKCGVYIVSVINNYKIASTKLVIR